MERKRDESRWKYTNHSSPQDFLAIPRHNGAHSITIRNQKIDLLIEDRLAATTIVVFHSRLTNRYRTYPVFSGQGMAARTNANLVAISDPSIAMGDVDLAWYLGNRQLGALRPHLSPLIHHVLVSLDTERTLLFGASGGAYAALNFASDFPDSIVLVVNPRLNLSAKPYPPMAQYLKTCHFATSATPMKRIRRSFVTDNLADVIGSKLASEVLLFQNTGDHLYYHYQTRPFIELYKDDPKLHTRFQHYATGHKALPTTLLDSMLHPLASIPNRAEAITRAGFTSINGLTHRLKSDKPTSAGPS